MKMKRCDNCGSINNYDARFCHKCGERLSSTPTDIDYEDYDFDKALERLQKELKNKKRSQRDDDDYHFPMYKDVDEDKDIKVREKGVPEDSVINPEEAPIRTVREASSKTSVSVADHVQDISEPSLTKVRLDQEDSRDSGYISENSSPEDEKISIKRIKLEKKPISEVDSDMDVKIAPPITRKADLKWEGVGDDIKEPEITRNKRRNTIVLRNMGPDEDFSYDVKEDSHDEGQSVIDFTHEADVEEDRAKSRFLMGVLLALGLVVALGLGFYRFILVDAGTVAQADKLVANGQYKEAITLYDEVLKKKESKGVDTKKKTAQRLLLEKELLEKNPDEVTPEDLKVLFEMKEKSEVNSQRAEEFIVVVIGKVDSRVKKLMSDGDYKGAATELDPYLKVTDSDVTMNTLALAIDEHFKGEAAKVEEEKKKKEVEESLKKNGVTSPTDKMPTDTGTSTTAAKKNTAVDPSLIAALDNDNNANKAMFDTLKKESGRIADENNKAGRDPSYNMMTSQLEWELGSPEADVQVNLNDFFENYLTFMGKAVSSNSSSGIEKFFQMDSAYYNLQKSYIEGTTGRKLTFMDYKVENIVNAGEFFEVTVKEDFQIADGEGLPTKSSSQVVYYIERIPSYHGFIIRSFRPKN